MNLPLHERYAFSGNKMNEEATEYEKERQIVEKVNIKTSKWVKVRVSTSLIDRARGIYLFRA
jgi:hypothetical protein